MTKEDGILNLTQSSSPWKRSFGRLLATDLNDHVIKWFVSERERGTSPMDAIMALTEAMALIGAYAIVNCSIKGHEKETTRLFCESIAKSINAFLES